MKKTFLCLLLCLPAILFSSCDEDSVPSDKVRLQIQASAFDVVKNLKDTEGNLYFTGKLTDGYRLRITCIVYSYAKSFIESEKQESIQTAYLDDVTGMASFTVETDPGDFRVIATADLVKMNGNNVALAYNDIVSDIDFINVSVNFKNNGGYLNAAGTADSERISLEGGNKADVSLNIQPIGSLITTCFYNVDASKCKEITYRLSGATFKGSLKYVGDRREFYVLPGGTEVIIEPVAGEDTYYYQRYILVNETKTGVQWAGIRYFNNKEFAFVPGVNNYIKLDISTDEIVVYNDFVK